MNSPIVPAGWVHVWVRTGNLGVVLARHHGFRSCDKGGEESVELLYVHRPAALAIIQEITEAVEFGVGQWGVLG